MSLHSTTTKIGHAVLTTNAYIWPDLIDGSESVANTASLTLSKDGAVADFAFSLDRDDTQKLITALQTHLNHIDNLQDSLTKSTTCETA